MSRGQRLMLLREVGIFGDHAVVLPRDVSAHDNEARVLPDNVGELPREGLMLLRELGMRRVRGRKGRKSRVEVLAQDEELVVLDVLVPVEVAGLVRLPVNGFRGDSPWRRGSGGLARMRCGGRRRATRSRSRLGRGVWGGRRAALLARKRGCDRERARGPIQ
jgi:hypothetical protein